jgi:uncharacterized membrane-anchored protein YhcB (DUF1043 family)
MTKFILILIFGSLFAVTGMRCIPAVIEHAALQKTIERMVSSGESDRAALNSMFTKSAEVADIKSVEFRDLHISNSGSKLTIEYEYESRVHLFANLSLVIEFTNKR